MPIYQYVCKACDSQLEIRHGMSESSPRTCAGCGGLLERVYTPPRLNVRNSSSPTAAKYARMSAAEEVAHIRTELDSLQLSKRSKDNSSS